MSEIGYHNCDMATNGELLLLDKLQIGNVVMDVGAHTGEWSLNLLNFKKNIFIYCFEPMPIFCKILEQNLRNQPVSLHEFAVSKENATATFVYYPKHPGLSTLHRRPEIENMLSMEPIFFDVETKQLDLFCVEHQLSHIDFLKIDTEGNELNVLLGAENLLKNGGIDLIQFEYGGCYLDSKTTLKSVYDLLTKYDYEIYRITSFGLIEILEWNETLENFAYSNYLAAKKVLGG